ncbi:MAG: hypoxanthine-guanine phosphoribosyltransferase [Piscirickettsiaceae bacterium]|nr:MAG: hypoxanthine-guanine phosphoribosyltransferase [Piscirickettsiaceae bacterium]
MTDLLKEIAWVQTHSRCLLAPSAVDGMLDNLAKQISVVCADKNPVVLCVMTGAVVATGLLLPRLLFPLELDYIHVTRYQNNTTAGELSWKQEPTVPLKNRHVLIVDDVLDEGITLQAIKTYCEEQGAIACYSAVLVNKDIHKPKPVTADFVGLQTGPEYLYGLGMDYKGYGRNAVGIYACPDNLKEFYA